MSVINATTLRKRLFGYLKAAVVDGEKITVATKRGNAAIVGEEYLRSLEETCRLLSIPDMAESIAEGLATPLEECVTLDWENDLK